MRGVTHLVGGLTVAVAITPALPALWPGAVVAGLAALVPDWINVAVPGLRVRGATGHRGFTHWLLTALLTSAAVWQVSPELGAYWLAGYLSHLALDVLTTAGAPVFWPLPWRVSLLPVREGGRFDGALAGALAVVALVVVLTRWGT